ncbi:predicted protein [Chaetoceros tenuissimus]|uniref:Uncharacterized protein n=1 Tax=Chaetoceros tenuissimus TaxID=426638 RepID=A0AAD3HBK9_9STRA|nr:predicted protein [Chaetoceros tenuissimus]
MDWKIFNMELHECISNPGEIDAKEKRNQRFAHITMLWKQLPEKEHLPNKGSMYCRFLMLRVISLNLALIFANSQEVIEVGFIQELLEELMQALGTLWGSLQRGGFQQNIYSYSTRKIHDAIFSQNELHLFKSQDVALKFSHMQQLVFKKRLHCALAYQYHSLSKETKIAVLERIKNSFQMHVDANTFREMSFYVEYLVSSTDLKSQKVMEELDQHFYIEYLVSSTDLKNRKLMEELYPRCFSGINITIQQLEKDLIPLPPKPVVVEPYPNNDELHQKQINPDVRSIRSANIETMRRSADEFDNESNEQSYVSSSKH